MKSATTREGESAICGHCGVGGVALFFPGQGRKALQKKLHKMVRFEG